MKYLIVIDMQNDFITGALANPAAQEIVSKIADYVKHWNGHLIFTRDTHYSDYLETMEGKNLPVKHCIKGTEGWEVCEEIREAVWGEHIENMCYVDKPTFGYVEGIKKHITYPTSIEVVGTCTDICVISNVLSLKEAYPETEIIVHENMCAGLSPELHEAAIKVMKSCQVKVI